MFKFTAEFLNATALGSNDAARRVAIVQALAAAINNPNADFLSDVYEYNLILCPGYHEVVDEMISLSLAIHEEAFVIGDTPMNMSPEDVVSLWADSTTSTRQHSNDTSYYYPHCLGTNLDGAKVYCAMSGTALKTYAYSDSVSEVWFAPAGITRGVVTGIEQVGYVTGTLGTATTFVPTNLNQGQRDNLYKNFTNINPVPNLPGRGIIIFGQKTSQSAASALDRVNVARLMKYIRRQLRKSTVPFLFEPNDSITRGNVKAMVDGFLHKIMVKRGLYDFATICDTSNNTPDVIDNNELYIDIAVQPEKSIEFIYIPIVIRPSGASLFTNVS
jgi:phage tail sheath protein FI